MTFCGIQDQEVMIKPYFNCANVSFKMIKLLDQMFFNKKTGYFRQHNYKGLDF